MIANVVAGVLFVLAAWHVYWAFGGRRGLRSALPRLSDEAPLFRPPAWLTLLVASALFAAGMAALGVKHDLPVRLPMPSVVLNALAAVFLLRAVGDFRHVGLFKRVTGSSFARWDTRLFTPLCVALGVGFLVLARSR